MKRSKFSLSNYKLFSCDMGELVPCGLVEVLPGDTIQHSTMALVRAAPLLAPVMHPVDIRIHHWFVPHRLVWEDWEDFITGGPDGMDASVFPTKTITPTVSTLADYLGLPIGPNALEVSALPFRGYQLIWNEWYRDQDLQTPAVIDVTSGPDTTTNVNLATAAWEKDYFTSARPFEQKGPSITIPIGNTAPVLGIAGNSTANTYVGTATGYEDSTGVTPSGSNWSPDVGGGSSRWTIQGDNTTKTPNIRADLSNASAVTITALREALALQRYEEARARYGSRYVEYLRYLQVRSSDARLQRPEYLGGGRQTLQFSEVLQTAEGSDPVGQMAGHGIAVSRSNRYRRFFEEHGYVFSLMSVRPKTIYADGIPRTWNRRNKEDFWQRELQHIGQQEVVMKEVYAHGGTPEAVFGYQDRYDEYRRMESSLGGEFRTSLLSYWHLARLFSSQPALNSTFVNCNPSGRIFAVPTASDSLYVMARHSIQARRLVARTGESFIF